VLINWKKGQDLLYAGDAKITQNERMLRLPNNTLLIKNAQPSDSSDEYKCEALEKKEIKKLVHRLLVREPQTNEDEAVRILPHEFIELEQGESITVSCEAHPDLRPKAIAWSREVSHDP
jgi:hypothetical protein